MVPEWLAGGRDGLDSREAGTDLGPVANIDPCFGVASEADNVVGLVVDCSEDEGLVSPVAEVAREVDSSPAN